MHLELHPLAKIFPPLAHEELVALADDLKRNGQRQPVIIFEGRILDGRNRYEASKLAGLKSLRIEQFDPAKAGCSPASFVISQNLKRRHLSVGQRAAIGLDWSDQWAAERKKSGTPLPNSENGGRVKGFISDTARVMGIPEQRIYEARSIRDADPALYEHLKSGARTLHDALVHSKKDKIQAQTESIKKPTGTRTASARRKTVKPVTSSDGYISPDVEADPQELDLTITLADLLDMARKLKQAFEIDLGEALISVALR